MVALLAGLAQTHGVRLGFATAHCWLDGVAEEDDDHLDDDDDYGFWYDGFDNSDDDVEGFTDRELHVEFTDDPDPTVELADFVDLGGELIAKKLIYSKYRETIPEELTQHVHLWERDWCEFGGDWSGAEKRYQHFSNEYSRDVCTLLPFPMAVVSII